MCLWKSRHPGDEEPERERGEAVENLFCKFIMVRMCKLMCKLIMVRSAAKQCPRPGLRDDIWDSRQDLHRGGRWHMGGDSHPPHRLGLPSRPLPDCLNPETSHLSYSHLRLSNFLQCTMDGSKDGVREHKTQLRQTVVTTCHKCWRSRRTFGSIQCGAGLGKRGKSGLEQSLSIFVTLCQSLSIFVIFSLNHRLVCP